jgi:hypothetical protein
MSINFKKKVKPTFVGEVDGFHVELTVDDVDVRNCRLVVYTDYGERREFAAGNNATKMCVMEYLRGDEDGIYAVAMHAAMLPHIVFSSQEAIDESGKFVDKFTSVDGFELLEVSQEQEEEDAKALMEWAEYGKKSKKERKAFKDELRQGLREMQEEGEP